MQAIERFLESRIGLDPESVGASAIASAVRSRMRAISVPTVKEYAARLDADGEEVDALIEAIVVSETWFMRDAVPFGYLAEIVSRRASGSGEVRVLSAPCATGEEPYSIAISLDRAGLDGFAIEGVDISQRAIQAAERAVYGDISFRGDCEPWRSTYFDKSPQGFRVREGIRRRVTFRTTNVVAPGALGARRFHVVFCRNLLIYLGRDARAVVLDAIERCLLPGGTIFVGHAEALGRMDARFVRVGPSGAFAYQRAADARRRSSARAQRPSVAKGSPRRAERTASKGAAVAVGSGRDAKSPRAPSVRPLPPSRLALARSLADAGDVVGARSACEESLAKEGRTADAYVLLGSILRSLGQASEAEHCFERALYLEPAHHEALVHLTILCEQRGENARAERYRARAERAAFRGRLAP